MKKNGVGLQFSVDNYNEKGIHSSCRKTSRDEAICNSYAYVGM